MELNNNAVMEDHLFSLLTPQHLGFVALLTLLHYVFFPFCSNSSL